MSRVASFRDFIILIIGANLWIWIDWFREFLLVLLSSICWIGSSDYQMITSRVVNDDRFSYSGIDGPRAQASSDSGTKSRDKEQ